MPLPSSLRDALRIPASEITDEAIYRDRRRLIGLLAAAPALALSGCAEAEPPPPPKTKASPAQLKSGFRTTEELTRLEDVTTYNNFYEFGTGKADPWQAGVIMAGGGLHPDHVPWLARAGVRAFHIGAPARPQGSYKAYVDADLVRSWRRLIDTEIRHASVAGQH